MSHPKIPVHTVIGTATPETRQLAALAQRMAAPLADCVEIDLALSAALTLATDLAIAAGVPPEAWGVCVRKAMQDRLELQPEQRLVQFARSQGQA